MIVVQYRKEEANKTTNLNNNLIMKKIIFTAILAMAAMNTNAQLVVDSLGRVGIGTDSVKSMLAVGTSGSNDSAIRFNAHGKQYGLFLMNYTQNTGLIVGNYTKTYNSMGSCYGGKSTARGLFSSSNSQNIVGFAGYAGPGNTGVGLLGCPDLGNPQHTNFAGVYGSETNGALTFLNYSSKYAGYFRGKVCVTNGIYATVLSPSASASPSGQGGTTILSDRGESVTNKLSQVQTLQFLRYDPTKTEETRKAPTPVLTEEDIENMSPEELEALEETASEEPEQYLAPVQYGLDAEQLKAVYPELVYEDANGNVSINYVEMVPLLVQSINELTKKVAELEGTSAKRAKAISGTTAIEDKVSDVDMVRMDQNKPNPFSESTVISLNIPEKTQTASIFIYDMSGKQVQNLPVTERGETDITVYARDLTAGMYIYTLVVDGKVEVTRRMIVSE